MLDVDTDFFIFVFHFLATNTTIGGLNGLVEDILAILPQDEIFILFFEKLDNSPKFGSFVQSVGNSDFHRKCSKLWVSKLFIRRYTQRN